MVALRIGVALAILASTAHAQSLTPSPLQAPPPAELSAGVKAEMQKSGFKVASGETTLELWWVSALKVTAQGEGWEYVESGTLVGAVRITGSFKEIRGKPVKPGVYTLRYGLQPQNGDHLGISPNREFLLLSPAAVDQDPKTTGFDPVVALSKQTIGTSHPASLSLDPPLAPDPPLSTYSNDQEHKGVVFDVPQSLNGKVVGTLRFGLIVIGLIVH
ncbi:MAG: hypothetical protein ACRD2N_06565 [Vicinamibacterales bacterium]